jgi:hypothetical protein
VLALLAPYRHVFILCLRWRVASRESRVQYLLGGDTDIRFLRKPLDGREFVATVAEVLAADISITE